MGDFFRSVKFKIILCILGLLLGILLFSLTKGGYTSTISEVFGVVFNPLKQASNAVSGKIDSTIDQIHNAQDYYDENEALRAQIGELNSQLVDYHETKAELEELRKFLGIKEEHSDFQLSEPCHIISWTTNDPARGFVIDRGTEDGISVNDPVLTGEGLAGVVVEAAGTYSTVRTVLSPDLSIGALSSRTGDSGIVEGTLKLASDQQTRMIYIDKDSPLAVGDLIITAGGSGLFPRGCVIGSVASISLEESGLSKHADITPAVNFDRLDTVVVLIGFDGKGDGYSGN